MDELNAKDLMVGDWVSYKGKMPCKITAICKDTAVVDNDTEQDWRIDYDKLTPIPLTAEILEKNFPTIEDGVTWSETADSDLFNIRAEYDKYVEGIFKYVHEFQHAMRLAGIDKEITI